MPHRVFVDTAGWASLFVATETYHKQAVHWFGQVRDQGGELITTNYVLIELVALLNSPLRVRRSRLFQYVDAIRLALFQSRMELGDCILEAVKWYTRYLRQEQTQSGTASWADSNAGEQARLLRRIHEELAPYTVGVLQAIPGDGEEDWEALLA